MQTSEAIFDYMNRWGALRRPFFFMLDFEAKRGEILPISELAAHSIFADFSGSDAFQSNWLKTNQLGPTYLPSSIPVTLKAFPMDIEAYRSQFEAVQDVLKQGDSFLLNLTCETPININRSLEEIFIQARSKYKLLYKKQFVSTSPETFIQIKEGVIHTHPMKGTLPVDYPNAEQTLLADVKEKAEHSTIVDLLRNDLSRVAHDVQVKRFRYTETLETHQGGLLQTSSHITGTLPENYQNELGDLLKQLLPAGSISGAPKKKTVQHIKQIETHARGFYTGIMGIFDGNNLDTAVLIRMIVQTQTGLVYKSGGGITALSQLEEEYNEMQQKIYVPIH